MADEPLAYKQFFIWAEQEEDGFRAYIAHQDGRPLRSGPSDEPPTKAPLRSPDVFETKDQALVHARSMADIQDV